MSSRTSIWKACSRLICSRTTNTTPNNNTTPNSSTRTNTRDRTNNPTNNITSRNISNPTKPTRRDRTTR